MIFVSVGSQKFQFDRLLKKIDELIEKKVFEEEVYAQIGSSNYKPLNYDYKEFMDYDEFNYNIDRADLIITHAGTGIIVNSVKKRKKVIGIPRLSKYNEHVDDHQIQLIKEFSDLNYIEPCYEVSDLEEAYKNVKEKKYDKYESNIDEIIKDIRMFIDKNC